MMGRIPVTVISGYLGAGKTTLINNLLNGNHGRRIAVLVNDFGSVNIDAALIESEGEDAISLANGCVCCSITDDLGTALQAQADRPAPPELVVLEASGVADPARIACHAGSWPGFELDAVITLVDVETISARLTDKFVGQLVRSQIEAGDLVGLTKTDLVPEKHLSAVYGMLEKISPHARLLHASEGSIDPLLLVGLGAASEVNQRSKETSETAHLYTAVWKPDAPLRKVEVERRLERLPETIHRVKGFFIDADTGLQMLVQKVGKRCTLTPHKEINPSGLVLIGVGGRSEVEAGVNILSLAAS